jgi:hypothetical protein
MRKLEFIGKVQADATPACIYLLTASARELLFKTVCRARWQGSSPGWPAFRERAS